ncbi:flagellar motor switch protein FliM [Microbacterium sp. NPDC058021]|uniref:flagellar motor switch protein FliM n=1 Tax=Microbacterium sp. NPDC058021 TaxID=3346306 RepID=UPI0036DF2218
MQIDDRAHPTTGPERYDFGRPAALSREHTRALAGAFDAFARQWAIQLTSKTRLRAHIAVERVNLETYDEYVATVPLTTTLVICAAEDSDDRIIVEFPLDTALSWIVKMLGGDVPGRLDTRSLTAVEQALLRALMDETLAHLRGSLGALLPQELTVNAVQYNSAFAQIAAAQELVVVARFSMKFADRTETATIALPAASLLERLSRTASAPHAVSDPGIVRWHVEETPVELTLRLTPRSMRPSEVLTLSVGDVIPLPHGQDRPLDLAVGDNVVASAAVGANGARLACVVTSSDLSHSLVEEQK